MRTRSMIVGLSLSFTAAVAFAKTPAPKPIYQITADLYQDGKKLSSSSLTTQEGLYGGIRSHEDGGDSNSLVLIPQSSTPDGSRINVEFKFFRKDRGDVLRKRQTIEVAAGETTVVPIEREHSLGPYEIHFTASRLSK